MVEPTILEIALEYVHAGLSVIPILADGSKAPAVPWKVYQRRLPTEKELRDWFRPGTAYGLAIVGGAVSGNDLAFDFEFPHLFVGWCRLLEAEGFNVNRLPQICTPGKAGEPGRHVHTRTPRAMPCQKLANIAAEEALRRTGDRNKRTGIEVKGEGGYVLAPGCPAACHPSGRLYQHVGGPELTEIPELTQEEVDLLISCARALDRMPQEEAAREYVGRSARGNGSAGELPGD